MNRPMPDPMEADVLLKIEGLEKTFTQGGQNHFQKPRYEDRGWRIGGVGGAERRG